MFAHTRDELVTYKAKICKSYSATGSCPFGDNCNFAHGEDDLRVGGQSEVGATLVSRDAAKFVAAPPSPNNAAKGPTSSTLPSLMVSLSRMRRNTVCTDHAQGKLSPQISPQLSCSTAPSMDCNWSDASVDSNGLQSDLADFDMPDLEDVKSHESHQWTMRQLSEILDDLVLDSTQSSRREWAQKYNERIAALKESLGDGVFNGDDGFVRPERYWDQMCSSFLTLRDSLQNMDLRSLYARRSREESLEKKFWNNPQCCVHGARGQHRAFLS